MNTKKLLTAGLAAATLVGTVSFATESSAQHRYYYHHDNSGAAVAAGITGLALGAALASSNNGYYYGPRYAYAPGYYAPGYYAPTYYGGYRTCYGWRHDRWGRAYRVTYAC